LVYVGIENLSLFAVYREEHLAAIGTTDFSYKHDAIEDSTFQLVDSTKLQSRSNEAFYYFLLNLLLFCLLPHVDRRQNAPSGRFGGGGGRGSGTGGRLGMGMQPGRGGMLSQSDGFAAQGSLAKAGGILAGYFLPSHCFCYIDYRILIIHCLSAVDEESAAASM